ncbi:hypothetical protein Cch01nite_36740 [Cellulomonas chitinilytica]|uniref:DUF4349 domain-containing protein n=1 Tax=Cellulomonas chitinilytica TaxID=398759 RepID=A0A919P643_9CELL|nr:DUF4349 domain-containing protein [Cellulomonas chitinilytica]GIG22950.1 hypothetical protein Cch01nite_36740 [Cellulomonas chitinilytica]
MTSTTSRISRPRRSAALGAAALLAATLALGACSAGDDSGSSDSADVASDAGAAAGGNVGGEVGGDVGSDDAAAGSQVQPAADGTVPAASTQQVVQVGELSMSVDDVRVAADAVVDLAEKAGGRVDDRTEHDATAGTRGTASLKIRVPSTEMTATLAALRTIGTVDQVDLHSQDVTNVAKDLDARIHGLELSVARMQDLLARATTNEAVVSAENSLTERQTNLEQLQSQRALLADQVRLSTLTVAITGPEVVVAPEPEPEPTGPQSFLEGLSAGWSAFAATVKVVVVLFGVLLPWLAFGGAIAAGVVAVSRWRRARSEVPAAPVPAPVPVQVSADDEPRS